MLNSKIQITIDENGQVQGQWPHTVEVQQKNEIEIIVKKNAQVQLEVTILTPVALHYTFEPFSQTKLVEIRHFTSGGNYHQQLTLLENSSLLGLLLNDSDHQGHLKIVQKGEVMADANVELSYGEVGDGHVDGDYAFQLLGQGAHAHLHLAAIARNQDVKHYQITLNHLAPNTYGVMENYGVTRHQSSLTFDGVGRINKGMHHSDSHQTSRIIVFEQGCKAKANPYLYIDDYDVKASHAASVGAMNEEHLYYLQSRGLTKKQAMHLITLGYLLPAIKVFKDDALMERFESTLLRKVGDN